MKATKKPPARKSGQGRGRREINGEILDVSTGGKLLGFNEKTTRSKIARKQLPFRRLGGRIVFIKSELIGYINNLPGCRPEECIP